MKGRKLFLLPAALALGALTLGATQLGAQSQRNCVRFASVEATGSKNSLDPAHHTSTHDGAGIHLTHNRLVNRDENWRVSPELASSWKSNKSGTIWTFQLRRGVKFHDGHELTAADVVYTFRRLLNPKTGSAAKSSLAFLTPSGIRPSGRYAVQFRTKSPVAELPLLITIKQTWIVANGADDETIKTKGAGTGPFRVVDFKPLKTRQLFVRNADYWQKGLPKAKCIEVSVVQEATSKLAAIQTNQVDVIQAVDLNTIAALKKNQGVRLLVSVPSTLVGLTVRIDTPPFDDNRVRLAMKKVIDRQKMVDVLLLGFGAVGDDNPIPPTSPAAWRHKVPGQDIEGAKKLLAAAGYSESKPLEVSAHCSDFIPGLVNLCQLYQQMAAQAGIKVDLVTGPASEFFDTVWLKKPFVVTGWGARPPGEALAVAYRADAEWNETHWKRPDYEALLDKANATLNPSKRVAGFRSAAKLLALEGGIIVPMFTKTVAGVRSNCSGYKPSNEFALPELRFVSCKR